MDSKTLYSDIPEGLRRYTADTFDDKYKRLDWDDVSRSITAHIAKDGYWYIHPEEHRTLTVREAARIQTFPDKFRFSGTRSDAFRQIGNAVPPLLGEAAARALTAQAVEPRSKPKNWLAARKSLTRWAKRQRKSRYWFMLPGSAVTQPVAVAAAVLSGAREDPEHIGDALRSLRGRATLDASALTSAGESLSGKTASALARLRPLVRRKKSWLEPTTVATIVGLKPAESQIYALLCGNDVLLRSQGVLRVAARVNGTKSHKSNRLN
jgi:DNA (cytosine-5)-methyltransferase 1